LVDAVAQTTKQGFGLMRRTKLTGESLFPVEYKKYAASNIPGEKTADTQPLPTKPAP
jgi:quinoprotein glucose dehydrogenase